MKIVVWRLVRNITVFLNYHFLLFFLQIQAAFRTDEIRRTPPTPQDEMRAGMSYFHETIWKGVPKFLRRVDTALKNIGIDERVPYNAPLIQFSSWMGGDRDGIILFRQPIDGHTPSCISFIAEKDSMLSIHCFIFCIMKTNGNFK